MSKLQNLQDFFKLVTAGIGHSLPEEKKCLGNTENAAADHEVGRVNQAS